VARLNINNSCIDASASASRRVLIRNSLALANVGMQLKVADESAIASIFDPIK
jgi:hypothetical protein